MLDLDAAYRYLIGLGPGAAAECSCGYPERWLAPARLDVLGIGPGDGYVVLCPACGALTGAIVER